MDEILRSRFEGQTKRCPLRRLSDVITEEGVESIDLLKIDVQRSELDVLAGIGDADWRKIRQIVMEVHDLPGAATEGRVAKIRDQLSARGYEVVVEQEDLLSGTDRYNLYAVRRGAEGLDVEEYEAGDEVNEDAAAEVTPMGIVELLRRRLPEYMIPRTVVVMRDLPMTRNGKVDRASLPAPQESEAAEGASRDEACNEIEELMRAIWAEVLGEEAIGVEENFFEKGGHSLIATQLISRVREVFKVELRLRSLFQEPTVRGLAGELKRRSGAAGRWKSRASARSQGPENIRCHTPSRGCGSWTGWNRATGITTAQAE